MMRPPGLRGLTIATLILALLLFLTPNLMDYFGVSHIYWGGVALIWDVAHPWQPLYKVNLPEGACLIYKLRQAFIWFDAEYYLAQVAWQTPEGKSYSFDAGGVYTRRPDVEFRLRDDAQAVWVVVRDKGEPPHVHFTLDLVTGKATGKWELPRPEWATVDGGRRLNKHIVSKE